MLSIKDIARECNVHPTTVSRALNQSKEISLATRNKILEVCKKLGYRPNRIAQSLILKRTFTVGLLIPDITNQYYSFVSKGVSSYLDKIDYGLILCNSDRSKSNELKYIDFLIGASVDGVIILPTKPRREDYEVLIKYKIPFVFVDNYVDDLEVSFIGNDNYTGSRKLVRHMIQQNYKRIGFILGDERSTASNERLKAYQDVMRENNLEIDNSILIHTNATFDDGFVTAERLIEQGVDSIFAINDTVAMGVMKYCFNKGIRIPMDLGLAGYDDIEQSSMLPIPLTTVHQKKFSLGQKAAEILIKEIAEPTTAKQKVILQPELVIRKSCKE